MSSYHFTSVEAASSGNLSQCLAIFYTNARSLVNKMELLRSYVFEYKPDIMLITETWGNVDLPDAYFMIDGYVMHRNDRKQKNKGGGVIIYIS